MVQPASDKPRSRPTAPRNDTLTADARHLHALSRELRQATGPKRKNDYPSLAFSPNPAGLAASPALTAYGYLTGIIRCWYGVPGHITYGTEVSGSASFGYMS